MPAPVISSFIDPTVTVGSVTAGIGGTADVALTIDNSANLESTYFIINYNPSLLSLPSSSDVTLGAAFQRVGPEQLGVFGEHHNARADHSHGVQSGQSASEYQRQR